MEALVPPRAVLDTAACILSFQVDRMPDVDPASRRGPAYLEELRKASIEGSVLARFVVDTQGKIEPSSFREVSSSHRYFTDAVRRAIPRLHYLPAMKDGMPVRCWTEQRFDFSLTSPE